MGTIDHSGRTNPAGSPNVDPIKLSAEQIHRIAEHKVTCPFLAAAIDCGGLAVRNSVAAPLASVEDVVALGDSGGGDLGSKVLKVFARGNHSRMPGPSGALDAPTPNGMMSLDLAGSQGAHPGHSGILLGDPRRIDGGRFSAADFERLAKHADGHGYLSTQAVGVFIAENLARDPDSKIMPFARLAFDLFGVLDELGDGLFAKLRRRKSERDVVELLEKLTKLAGEDNLVGAAGEFGLLFAFLANRPDPTALDDKGIRLDDVETMMVEHRFPDGWESWEKNATDWVRATARLTASAAKAYLRRRDDER